MSPGSTVQAFPKCFCALPGITQLHCMGFLFREIPEVALTHEFLSDLWRLHCSHTAKQSCLFCTDNNLFLLQSASFLSLCGYSILTSQSKLNAVWVLLRSPVVQCLSRVMTARLCQGHCNVFYSVLSWASFRQHNFCSEMKYKNNVANRMIIKKKKPLFRLTFISYDTIELLFLCCSAHSAHPAPPLICLSLGDHTIPLDLLLVCHHRVFSWCGKYGHTA